MIFSIGISRTMRGVVTVGGGERGFSTIVTRVYGGLKGLVDFTLNGLSGISTIGLGVLVGTKSDWPVDRKIPFLTGHGAEFALLFDIITRYRLFN